MSPIIQPDTSEAQDMSPIEPGTYPGTIVQVELQTSKKGNAMIVPKWEVTVDGKTRTRTSYLVIDGPGSAGFDQLLRACGFDELADQYKDPDAENPEFDTDQLINQQCNLVVESQMYNNELRDNIKSYLPA